MPGIVPSVQATDAARTSKLLVWWKGKNVRQHILRHLLSIVIWTYCVGIFAFDFDGWLIANLPEPLKWIVIYKLLVFLTLAAIIFNFVPRKVFWSWTSYVLLWPFTRVCLAIVVVAILLYRLKSWNTFFAVLNFVFAWFTNFKFNFLLYVLALIAVVTAIISRDTGNLKSAALLLSVVVIVLVGRRLVGVFRPSPIFNVYVGAMSWTMDYCRRKIIKPRNLQGVDPSNLTLKEFEEEYGQLSTAISLAGACAFLETRFREYRGSGVAMATYFVSLIYLLVVVILLLSFTNWALFKADASAFHFTAGHQFMDFVYYSFEAITSQRTGEIVPVSVAARLVSVLETILGIILVAGVLVSLFLAVKRDRDHEAVERAIERLQAERLRMNQFVEDGFSVPLDEAVSVLEKVKGGIGALIKILREAQAGIP